LQLAPQQEGRINAFCHKGRYAPEVRYAQAAFSIGRAWLSLSWSAWHSWSGLGRAMNGRDFPPYALGAGDTLHRLG